MATLLDIDYLTEVECAAALKRSICTLIRMRQRGDGPPFIQIGGRGQILYRKEAVRDYLLSLERRAA